MPTYIFENNPVSFLASNITAVATTIFLNTGDGAKFPSPSAGQHFAITIVDSSNTIEILYCTARAADTLTVSRGEEGTTPFAFLAADNIVEGRVTRDALAQFAQKDGTEQASFLSADSKLWDGATKTVSTSAPAGGVDGDVHFQYE